MLKHLPVKKKSKIVISKYTEKIHTGINRI